MDDGHQDDAANAPEPLALPREVALAWGIETRPRRGRQPRLTLEAITEAAVAIADAEGLAAVSMSRVAAALGFSPMSLYRYVDSKDGLLRLMMDTALGAPPAPDEPVDDWRAAVVAWTRAALAAFRRHPWGTEVPILSAPVLPNNVAWMDRFLRIIEPTPLTPEEKLQVLSLVSNYARGEAALDNQLRRNRNLAGMSDEEADVTYARTMDAVVDADRFPTLRTIVDEVFLGMVEEEGDGLGGGDGPGRGDGAAPGRDAGSGAAPGRDDRPPDQILDDAWFDFGLDRILDGVQALVDRRTSEATGSAGGEAADDGAVGADDEVARPGR